MVTLKLSIPPLLPHPVLTERGEGYEQLWHFHDVTERNVYEAQLQHIPVEHAPERLAAFYRIAELQEEKLLDANGYSMNLHESDKIWTEETGHRTRATTS